MELKCRNKVCGYIWEYKGKHKFYATCPRCLRKVNVISGQNILNQEGNK